MMRHHYAILGVAPDADAATIKSAYRRLAKEFHPDTNKTPGAEDRFKEISEAYEAVKVQGPQGPHAGEASGAPSGMSGVNLDDLMRDIWGEETPSTTYSAFRKNKDIYLNYSITLKEAFQGADATVRYDLPGGRRQEIQIKINKGIHDGTLLRFAEMGSDAMADIKRGNLFVKIGIVPDPRLFRVGDHLVTVVEISYLDAMLGVDLKLPVIEGEQINLKIPAGVLPGQSLRATGKGMSISTGGRGDLMIEVHVVAPVLSREQKDLLEKVRSCPKD